MARELWLRLETIHAVTYFGSESREAATRVGLKGFWMGYFGFRAAPLGAVGAGAVEAIFANFAPEMVRRSVPDVWAHASPEALLVARHGAASSTLRRLVDDVEAAAAAAEAPLEAIVMAGATSGRPLFAANRLLPKVDDPVGRLWQSCTTLREHRGDGHVAALAAHDLDGIQAHQLLIADHGHPEEVFRDSRGWTDATWNNAADQLRSRGLLRGQQLTADGRQVRREVEALTDRLAASPIDEVLDEHQQIELLDVLGRTATEIATSGAIPFPNPMGLPRIGDDRSPSSH